MSEINEQVRAILNKSQKAIETLEPEYKRGNENSLYYRGENWTTSDINRHRADGFYHAFSIPLIATKINRILSMQRDNRFEWKVRGRGVEDELNAEVLNYGLKYIDDFNQFKWIESDIYKDGATKRWGVLKVWIDYLKNPLGDIKLEQIAFDSFYWDTNSRLYDIAEDGTFMGQCQWYPLDYVEQIYGETLKEQGFTFGEKFTSNYSNNRLKVSDWADSKKKLIKINEHYELFYEKNYLVKNFKNGDYKEFTKQDDVKDYIQQGLQAQAEMLFNNPTYSQTFTAEDFDVITKDLPKWKRIDFTGTKIIKDETHSYSRPPFFRYAAIFDDGICISLTDLAKDSQKAFDRQVSMMDKAIAKNIKGNNYELMADRLHPSETKDPALLMQRLSSGGYVVKVTQQGSLVPLQRQVDIGAEALMAEKFQGLVEDLLGGRTFQGLQSEQRQTATEVNALQQNSAQSGVLYIDNLARWKQLVCGYVIELMKDIYDKPRTFKILGEVRSKEVLETLQTSGVYVPSSLYDDEYGYIDTGKAKDLYDCNVDIIIDSVNATKEAKQSKMMQVMAISQSYQQQGMQPLSPEIQLYYADIDPTVKAKIQKEFEEQQKQLQRQQAIQEDAMKAQHLLSVMNATKPEAPKETVN